MGSALGRVLSPRSQEWSLASSNMREMEAVHLALKSFQALIKDLHIQIRLDNATTVAYINREGGNRSQLLSLSDMILTWAETNTELISTFHLKETESTSRIPKQKHGPWTSQLSTGSLRSGGHLRWDLVF